MKSLEESAAIQLQYETAVEALEELEGERREKSSEVEETEFSIVYLTDSVRDARHEVEEAEESLQRSKDRLAEAEDKLFFAKEDLEAINQKIAELQEEINLLNSYD